MARKRQSANMGRAEDGPKGGGDAIRQLGTMNLNQRVCFCLLPLVCLFFIFSVVFSLPLALQRIPLVLQHEAAELSAYLTSDYGRIDRVLQPTLSANYGTSTNRPEKDLIKTALRSGSVHTDASALHFHQQSHPDERFHSPWVYLLGAIAGCDTTCTVRTHLSYKWQSVFQP